MKNKITVIVVDDSAVVRGLITKTLQKNPHIEVVTTAFNGEVGVTYYNKYKPDVVIMDVEMPVMDGITALEKIMADDPTAKVFICSTLSTKNAEITMQALELGAIDCIAKPSASSDLDASTFQTDIIQRILSIGGYRGQNLINAMEETLDLNISNSLPGKIGETGSGNKNDGVSYAPKPKEPLIKDTSKTPLPQMNEVVTLRPIPDKKPYYKILAIGSSTGGPKALFRVLSDIGSTNLPIVITQHMPPTFTTMLAKHIEDNTNFVAREGAEDMLVEPGKVYIAPGGKHMIFEKDSSGLRIKLDDGPAESFCKPSVDVMFRNLVQIYNGNILAVMLTGMGNDGARSSQLLIDHGGVLIAQDEATSVVWGMPGAVAKAGLCHAVLPLDKIGAKVKQLLQG